MPIPPENIATGSLERRWRGYHPGQVDALLTTVRTDYAAAIDRIATIADEREQYRAGQEQLQRRLSDLADSTRNAADQAGNRGEAGRHRVGVGPTDSKHQRVRSEEIGRCSVVGSDGRADARFSRRVAPQTSGRR